MTLDLTDIEQKAKAATARPYRVNRCQFADREDVACGILGPDDSGDGGYQGIVYDASYDECHHVMSRADAEFLVAAANNAEAMVARIRELEAERDTWQRLGRAEAALELAEEKLRKLREAARGGAFVVGTYDAEKLVEQRRADVEALRAIAGAGK